MRGRSYSREHDVILLAELEMIHYTYASCDSTTPGTVTLMWCHETVDMDADGQLFCNIVTGGGYLEHGGIMRTKTI